MTRYQELTLGDLVANGTLTKKQAARLALEMIEDAEHSYNSNFMLRWLRGFKPPKLEHLKAAALKELAS